MILALQLIPYSGGFLKTVLDAQLVDIRSLSLCLHIYQYFGIHEVRILTYTLGFPVLYVRTLNCVVQLREIQQKELRLQGYNAV
jgi:hypothetical protein